MPTLAARGPPRKPRLPWQSEQIPLVAAWFTAANKGVTQGGKLLQCIVAPNLRNFGSSQLVAAFVIGMLGMALRAEMAACSSMRLVVVAGSPPAPSRPGSLYLSGATHPSGPGFRIPACPIGCWTLMLAT